MDDVKWIKLKVGMFDGASFKKIKRAKIGGESFRDKLTAVWFELMDFAGKCNHAGAFVDRREIPYTDLEDIAIMIDRETDELQLCMSFYINEGMVEIVDDVYQLTNWIEYQNEAGLEKIRENRRNRQARWREKKKLQAAAVDGVDGDVDTTQVSTECLPSYSYSNSTSKSTSKKEEIEGSGEKEEPDKPVRHKRGLHGWVLLTDAEYDRLVKDYGKAEAERCIAYVDESAQITKNKNKWSDWNLVVRKCHREGWGLKAGGKQQAAPPQNQSKGKKSFQELLAERNGTS